VCDHGSCQECESTPLVTGFTAEVDGTGLVAPEDASVKKSSFTDGIDQMSVHEGSSHLQGPRANFPEKCWLKQIGIGQQGKGSLGRVEAKRHRGDYERG